MRTVLVTGTAGFIGFHLARHLLAEGFRVIGVDAITDYEAKDADNQGGADEDRWDGIDDDGDDIIDEDLRPWVYEERFARLAKSILLMTTFEVPAGETVPGQWLWFDENADGQRTYSTVNPVDELIRDVNGNLVYNAGVDVVLSNGANGVLDTPNGASFASGDGNPLRDPGAAWQAQVEHYDRRSVCRPSRENPSGLSPRYA